MPVLGTMPAMFGMAAASHILCQLAGQPFNPEPIVEITEQQYETQITRLLEREETKYGGTQGVAVDYSDVSPPLLRSPPKKNWIDGTRTGAKVVNKFDGLRKDTGVNTVQKCFFVESAGRQQVLEAMMVPPEGLNNAVTNRPPSVG